MNDLVLGGHALPTALTGTHAYAVLWTFVALNTVMYATLSLAKTLPALRRDGGRRRRPGRSRRAESRSIYPDAVE